jgi:hypothetical protein
MVFGRVEQRHHSAAGIWIGQELAADQIQLIRAVPPAQPRPVSTLQNTVVGVLGQLGVELKDPGRVRAGR